MTEEDTLKLFTNLSRSAVDSLLRNLMSRARQEGPAGLAELLEGSEERSTDELIGIVGRCLQVLRAERAHKRQEAELEMIQMNLEKLKGDCA